MLPTDNMGFFTSAKNAAVKTKLRGEVALLDREIATRQKALGVELYDLLVVICAGGGNKMAGLKAPSIFHANQAKIQEPFEACRSDIRLLMEDKEAKEQEIVHIEANRERSRPSRDKQEALTKAGNWISETGTEAKLQVLIKKIDRDMKLRKEQFGLDVFEVMHTEEAAGQSSPGKAGVLGKITGTGKGAATGVKTGIASRLSKMSKSEQDIQDCIERAKKDVGLIEYRKDLKVREMSRLENEN